MEQQAAPYVSVVLSATGLTASISVNALVTSLIVFKILKVFREVRQILGATSGRKLYSAISVIIESGMVLFSIQLARFIVTVVLTNTADNAYQVIVCIHEIFNVIIRLIISTTPMSFLLILFWK